MKKERLFYLDFVRTIAVIAILLTHFNAEIWMRYPMEIWDRIVITSHICNIYIGDFGVTLFFIVSGAALMYVYDERLEPKTFYKKRFMAIYPMFWIAYTIAFLFLFYKNKGFNLTIPKINIFLTWIGFDGYLNGVVPVFYILGEWFLGCIILIYLVFPLLRWGVKKHPVICCEIVIILYAWSVLIYEGLLNRAEVITTRIPEVLFGMIFVKYIKKVNIPMLLGAILTLVLNSVLKPGWNASIQTTYIGISAFCVLLFVSRWIRLEIVKDICAKISKYSYAIFLVHHVVIEQMTRTFDFAGITKAESYILFFECCTISVILAKILYMVNNKCMQKVKLVRKKMKEKTDM